MDLSIFFAGTAGSVPTARRGLPATLVRRGAHHLLFDCGEGTQHQLVRSAGLADVDAVFLTHYDVDHWLGLVGMIKSFALRDRVKPLDVYGPPGLKTLFADLKRVVGRPAYGLDLTELEPGDEIGWDEFVVQAFNVRHRGQAFGYAFVEDARPGRFDAELAEQLGVAPGPDFGRLQRGESVGDVEASQVVGPDRPGRRIVLSGDTAPCDMTVAAAQGADVLVHEATFTEDDRDRAAQTGHSTAAQAARIAVDAEVGLLALTHLSSRYPGREIRDEARAVFERTVVPRDFDSIVVPFAERGVPELVRWSERVQDPSAPR